MKTRIKSIFLTISIFTSILLVIYAINSNHARPFTTKITIRTSAPCFIEKDKPSLIVDKNGRRLLFTDKDFRVVHIESCDREYPIDKVNDVDCDGSNFYVLGVRNFPGTMDVDRVKVLRYDIDGRNPKVIYDVEQNPDEKKTSNYEMLTDMDFLVDLDAVDGIAYVTEFHNSTKSMSGIVDHWMKTTRIDYENSETSIIMDIHATHMYNADYFVPEGKVYITNFAGQIAKEDNNGISYIDMPEKSVVGGFRVLGKDRFVWMDEFSRLTYINNTIIENDDYIMRFGKSDSGIVWVTDDDILHFMPDAESVPQVIDSVGLTTPFIVLVTVETAACLWLIFIIVFFSIRKIKTLYQEKKYAVLAKAGLIAMAIACSLAMASYYTYAIISEEKNDDEKNLHKMCTFFARTIEPAELETTSFRHRNSEIPPFAKKLDTYTALAQNDDEYINLMLFKNIDGTFVHIYDSRDYWQYGSSIDYEDLASRADANPNHVGLFYEGGYSYIYDIQPIINKKGEVAGAIYAYKERENIQKKAVKRSMEIAISLFTIFVTIYVSALETGFFIQGRAEVKRRKQDGDPYPELAMSRTHGFLLDLLTAFDRVILVLITRRILMASSLGLWSRVTLLIAIPSILKTASSMIGSGLYWFLSKKGTIRKLLATSLFIMLASNCGIALALAFTKEAAFFLFCFLKLIGGTANECASISIGAVYRRSPNGIERYKALANKLEGENSSSILGTLMGGFILNTFGHTAMYIVNSIIFVPVIIFMVMTLPKHVPFNNESNDGLELNAKTLARFFFKPSMIFYFALLFLPMMAISSYGGFFFPLYTAAFDMPEIYITTLTVFAQVMSIAASNAISNAAEKHDHWLVTIVALGFTGMLFLGFKLNPGIIWAILVLNAITMMDSQCVSSREVLWKREAIKCGIKPGLLVAPISIVKKLISLLKEPLLSLFLLFGHDRACEMFGVFCIICAIMFLVTTAGSALRIIPRKKTSTS